MKSKICLFAGTTEGHRLADFLGGQDVQVTVSVATQYGASVLKHYENEKILYGKMPVEDIINLLNRENFDLVIDATHPYASSITGSISHACSQCSTRYLRLLRGSTGIPQDAAEVEDAAEAVRFLNAVKGNILLTTGSKELPVYKEIEGFSERVYARVLPLTSSLQACADAGLPPSHIIAMQGPFSEEMNEALLKSTGAAFLVTKDTADEGGFEAKINACRKTGAQLLVIGRPADVQGMEYAQVIKRLCRDFGCICSPRITVAGIGPGSREHMTEAAVKAISGADCLIGAARMIKAACDSLDAAGKKPHFEAVAPDRILEFIKQNPQYQNVTVLMSGDTGFYSGTKKLLESLNEYETEIIPGISSLSFLCSRMGISYEDVYAASLHGRDADLPAMVNARRRLFLLTGGSNDAAGVCTKLVRSGFGGVKVTIGQRLGYADEKLIRGTARELSEGSYDPLSVMLIENDRPKGSYVPGIPDELFERGGEAGKIVPMTKSEIRALCMSKLCMEDHAVSWDVGAGTGSVSVEMALAAPGGKVFAIEKRKDAIALLEQNREKFSADNIVIVEGTAPEALEQLPAPSRVFIGGSSGNVREIILAAAGKNPDVKIVATAVSLEAAAELTACINSLPGVTCSVISASISRAKKAGHYHLMNALNPVYIFEMDFHGQE